MPGLEELVMEGLAERSAAESPATDEPVEQEAPDTEPDPATETAADDEPAAPGADPLSEEALAAMPEEQREAVRAALAALGTKEREQYKRFRILEKKNSKLKSRHDTLIKEKQDHAQFVDAVRTNVAGLKNPDAKAMLTALGNLTGEDPLKMFEAISLQIATGRKVDPEMVKLRNELNELKSAGAADKQRAEQARIEREYQDAKIELLTVASVATDYPHLSGFAKSTPGDLVAAVEDMLRAEPGLKFPEACAILEKQLTESLGPAATSRTESGAPKAKSESSQSAPKSLSPSLKNRPAQTRPQTEEDRRRALANDPNILSAFGL